MNKAADGGISALHMAALNSHTECVQLLLDLAANVSAVTIQDGTTIDLIGIHRIHQGNLVKRCQHCLNFLGIPLQSTCYSFNV